MKTAFSCLITALLLPIALVRADSWRVSRDILGHAETTVVATAPLDSHVFANTLPGWSDVRVLDGEGHEVPRVVLAEREYRFEERHTEHTLKITHLEQLPQGGLAVVCEWPGTNTVSLTQLAVRTPLRNYEQTVTVFVPATGGSWQQIGPSEPLFDYTRFADVKKETVALPRLTNHVFRLEIGQADDNVFSAYTSLTEESDGAQTLQKTFKRYRVEKRPFRIDAVCVRDTKREAMADKPKIEHIAAEKTAVTEDRAQKETVLTMQAERWPLTGLALSFEQQNFERQIEVEADESGRWQPLVKGSVLRSQLPGMPVREHLEIRFPETRADKLRVRVLNRDNPSLTFAKNSVTFLRQAYSVAFIAEKGERYRLVYGNPDAVREPDYERSVLTYLRSGRKAVAWTLSAAPEKPVSYGAGLKLRRFLARHGLWLLSGLVMLVLGALVVRAVRRCESH